MPLQLTRWSEPAAPLPSVCSASLETGIKTSWICFRKLHRKLVDSPFRFERSKWRATETIYRSNIAEWIYTLLHPRRLPEAARASNARETCTQFYFQTTADHRDRNATQRVSTRRTLILVMSRPSFFKASESEALHLHERVNSKHSFEHMIHICFCSDRSLYASRRFEWDWSWGGIERIINSIWLSSQFFMPHITSL